MCTFASPVFFKKWRNMSIISNLHNKKGFSLVELLITIALISILMAIATPGLLSQRPKWHIKGTARDLASKLMATRVKAIQDNQLYYLKFNTSVSPNTFTMYKGELDETVTPPVIVETTEKVGISSLASGNARINTNGCSILGFKPNGASIATSDCEIADANTIKKYQMTVYATGTDFHGMKIRVSSFTGNISVEIDESIGSQW